MLGIINMESELKPNRVVDARDSLCPGPFWELVKAVCCAKVGDVIALYAQEESDWGTRRDAPDWIKKTGNEFIGIYDRKGYYELVMKKLKDRKHLDATKDLLC